MKQLSWGQACDENLAQKKKTARASSYIKADIQIFERGNN